MDISRAFMHELDHICLTGERVKFLLETEKVLYEDCIVYETGKMVL